MKINDILLSEAPANTGGLRLAQPSRKLANARQQQMSVANQFDAPDPEVAQQKADAAEVQKLVGHEITKDNALDIIPKLIMKYKDQPNVAKALVNVVMTSVSQGDEIYGQAMQQKDDKNRLKQQNIKVGGGKKSEEQISNDAIANASKMSRAGLQRTISGLQVALQRKGTNEAVTPPQTQQQQVQPQQQQQQVQPQQQQQQAQPQANPNAAPKSVTMTPATQQALMAQIQAAVKAMSKPQRNVLKARVQQAMLLKPGETPDPNKLMQHGQPVVNQAGIRQPNQQNVRKVLGKAGRAIGGAAREFGGGFKQGFKEFLGKKP